MRRAIWFLVLMVTVGLAAPVAAHAKPPKKCAGLVESTEEVTDLLDEYFEALDEYYSVPEGDPSEAGLLAEVDRIESELRSIDRILERDIRECKGSKTSASLAAPAAPHAKPPKKCAGLVESTEELSDVFDKFFETTDEYYSVPEGDPSEEGLLAELDRLEQELRSIDRILERDLRECKGS